MKGWRGREHSPALQELKGVHPAPHRRGRSFWDSGNKSPDWSAGAFSLADVTLERRPTCHAGSDNLRCALVALLSNRDSPMPGWSQTWTQGCHTGPYWTLQNQTNASGFRLVSKQNHTPQYWDLRSPVFQDRCLKPLAHPSAISWAISSRWKLSAWAKLFRLVLAG